MSGSPALTVLSLGAGVQSTTLFLLSAEGALPKVDFAVFADTGYEPRSVYEHLDRLEREVARPAGIEIVRVAQGHIRDDALDPHAHYAQMPLYVRGDDGGAGMMRRACTAHYKVAPIKAEVRRRLGYPAPRPVPDGVYVEQWIGISADEASRARFSDVDYMTHEFPLIALHGEFLGWRREDCARFLRSRGFGETPKSACVTCPYSGNARWRRLRDTCRCGHHRGEHGRLGQPTACARALEAGPGARLCDCLVFDNPEWRDAVAFDAAMRGGYARALADGKPLHGQAFVHRSMLPLADAPIDKVTAAEWKARQTTVFDHIADAEDDDRGCSPWATLLTYYEISQY